MRLLPMASSLPGFTMDAALVFRVWPAAGFPADALVGDGSAVPAMPLLRA